MLFKDMAKMFREYLNSIANTMTRINYLELTLKTIIVLAIVLTVIPELILLAKHFPLLFSLCLIVIIRDGYFQ
jgi:hypothetical protein